MTLARPLASGRVLLRGAARLHEGTDALKARIATFKAVLYEMYVLGEERREALAYLSEILQALDGDKMPPKPRATPRAR